MTDGPHKSLPMLPRWKKVAEYADKPAFEQGEVDAVLKRALIADYSLVPQAIVKGLQKVMDDPNDTIFPEFKIQKVEALRAEAAGPAFSSTLIDCCMERLQKDAPGPKAFESALADAFALTAASNLRSMEEHYHRRVGRDRANGVRSRLEGAIGTASYQTLARDAVGNKGKKMTMRTQKSGLDDGVRLK